ncbi:MAG: GspH/FimT family pseudopilin [Patescibacteria group bacterium]
MKTLTGFTLIELLIVIATLALVTTFSIASYSDYQNAQKVETSASEVVTLFQTAKSRALSQVKPTVCNGRVLESYRVTITPGAQNYVLSVICSGVVTQLETKKLSQDVLFTTGSTTTITFSLLTGAATSGTINITGYGKTKTITVNTVGNIGVN